MDFQYDVFFSYRHRPLDSFITEKTFHMLESYKLPDSFAQKGLHGVRRAFRDTEELAVTRILSDNIQQALHSTDCLVVVCSPDTPSSEWVDREVETFIELGRSHRIFPLLIAGTPEDSFPPALKRVPDVMHRLMDVRAANDRPKAILQQEALALLRSSPPSAAASMRICCAGTSCASCVETPPATSLPPHCSPAYSSPRSACG